MLSLSDFERDARKSFPGSDIRFSYAEDQADFIEGLHEITGVPKEDIEAYYEGRYFDRGSQAFCVQLESGSVILLHTDVFRPFMEVADAVFSRLDEYDERDSKLEEMFQYSCYAHEVGHKFIRELIYTPTPEEVFLPDVMVGKMGHAAEKYFGKPLQKGEYRRIEEIAAEIFSCVKTAEKYGRPRAEIFKLIADANFLIEYDSAAAAAKSGDTADMLGFLNTRKSNDHLTSLSLDLAAKMAGSFDYADDADLARKAIAFAKRHNNLLSIYDAFEPAADIGLFGGGLAHRCSIALVAKEITWPTAHPDLQRPSNDEDGICNLSLFAERYLKAEMGIANFLHRESKGAACRRQVEMFSQPRFSSLKRT